MEKKEGRKKKVDGERRDAEGTENCKKIKKIKTTNVRRKKEYIRERKAIVKR